MPLEYFSSWGPEDDALLADHDKNVYTSPGLRRLGVEKQGRQQDVVALAGFVLDLDMAHGRHKANERSDRTLASSDEDVAAILGDGPDPTLVVDTGGGFHFWWLFETPWLLEDSAARTQAKQAYKEFHGRYLARGKERGLWIDPGANTIQFQFRLPGTKNLKYDPPKEVQVVYQSDARLPLPALPRATDKTPPSTSTATLSKDLEPVREAMKRLSPKHEHKEAMKLVVQGKSFAEPGGRNDAMYRIVSTIAWLTPARKFPAEKLVELLRPSLSIWAAEPDAEKTLDEEIEIATAMFESAIENREERDRENAQGLEGIARWLRGSLRAGDAPVDADDTETVSTAGALQCSIVQYRTNYWAHCFDEKHSGYLGPFVKEELWTQLKTLWSDAPAGAFSLFTDTGKAKTALEIVQQHGVGALEVIGHLFLQKSYFDIESWRFHRAMCPLRIIEPVFDPNIDEWMRLLGGDKADKLLDWFAGVPKLDRPQCALYLEGPPGVGKTSIAAECSARLWREAGPASFISLLDGFNADMFSCPLILLDEGLPSRASHTSAFIRSLVAAHDHTWNEKNMHKHKVLGCVRLIIAANNDRVLAQIANEDIGEVDVEAMTERFLHIQSDDKAAEWIRKTNAIDRGIIDSWKSEGLFAKHIIWLAENRVVTEGRRFLIDGEATEMHRSLITRGEKQGLVLEWLARFLLNPDKVENLYKSKKETPLARAGNGQILVNTSAVVEQWKIYRDPGEKISVTPAEVGRILTSLSYKKRQLGARGDRVKYHQINWENVRRVAEDLQFDTDIMEQNVMREADFEIEPGPQLRLVQP